MNMQRVFKMSFASVYPHYVAKAEKKGRTKAEVDEIIRWLTGYSQEELQAHLDERTDFETFFGKAPRMNPARTLITGTICSIRVAEIKEPLTRDIRYVDKLIDELAKGRAMEKILR
jgi:hypothetical protein